MRCLLNPPEKLLEFWSNQVMFHRAYQSPQQEHVTAVSRPYTECRLSLAEFGATNSQSVPHSNFLHKAPNGHPLTHVLGTQSSILRALMHALAHRAFRYHQSEWHNCQTQTVHSLCITQYASGQFAILWYELLPSALINLQIIDVGVSFTTAWILQYQALCCKIYVVLFYNFTPCSDFRICRVRKFPVWQQPGCLLLKKRRVCRKYTRRSFILYSRLTKT